MPLRSTISPRRGSTGLVLAMASAARFFQSDRSTTCNCTARTSKMPARTKMIERNIFSRRSNIATPFAVIAGAGFQPEPQRSSALGPVQHPYGTKAKHPPRALQQVKDDGGHDRRVHRAGEPWPQGRAGPGARRMGASVDEPVE